ncbi:hypothetical protein [Natronococcus pandeyae]|uniref:hypothetical protein n=1 Tax=Natronococcus pandeyae TaxID=2055836 RepID=UPI0011E7D44E|nr:hypothetical protein [Natronococcus pandeyae]
MEIKFKKDDGGIDIIDPIERRREQIIIDESVVIEHTEWDLPRFPVDTAITTTTNKFTLPNTGSLYVRGENREIISEVDSDEDVYLPYGEYFLEMSKSIKIYININSSLYIRSNDFGRQINLGSRGEIIIGARSYHTQPAGAIVTTSSPRDVMQAISAFGSALKTSKPERSYPTLRGHPPSIELGECLDIPTELNQSDTPIQLEIPPKLDYVYKITSLAYYLGAEIVPGSKPCLVTNEGYSFDLDESGDFESTIERILRQVFFLDCIVRTEGHAPGSVHGWQRIESALESDLSELYNKPPVKRIESYLDIPFSTIESQYPIWNPRITVEPCKENIEFLPFIAESLSIVSTEDKSGLSSAKQKRSKKTDETSVSISQTNDPVIQQNWNCSGGSKIKSTTPLTAFYNDIDRRPKEDPLEIEVICNDPDMSAELVTAHSAYGNRDELPFDVTIHHNLTKGRLESILADESDFSHYIGHIDENGFRCTDGHLDASTLSNVGSKAFFLNACCSHSQGLELIKAGSIGGIVTQDKIQNNHAVSIGSTVARLLNLGYPLYATVDIARNESPVGEQYHIVGNGRVSVAQPKTIVPNSCSIIQNEGEIGIIINLYQSNVGGKGCIFIPSLDSIGDYHLVQQDVGPYSVTKAELVRFLDINPIPVMINESMYWSDDIKISDI